MAADEVLVGRVREHLAGDLSFSERRMFGGLAVMCNGNMAAGVIGDRLMVRVGPEAWLAAFDQQRRVWEFRGLVRRITRGSGG